MTREEHLIFCKKCLNRKFDPQQGLVCKLTDQIAQFEGSCENYDHDETVKEPVEIEERSAREVISQLPSDVRKQLSVHQDIVYAIIGGLFLSVICAIIWAVITVATEYQIGYMAIGLGLVIGWGVRYFGAGIDRIYGVIGGFLALLGCLLGNLFSQVGFIANAQGLGYFDTISLLDFETIILIYSDTFGPMDVFFYGIAVYEGYLFAFRPVPENYKAIQDFTPPYAQLRLPLVVLCFLGISFTGYFISKEVSGEQTFYYESGAVFSSGEFHEGKESGIWKYFYESGRIQAEASYKNGLEDGEWKWYYESGEPMRQGNYINGLIDGLWLNYYPSGILSDSSYYVQGRLQGASASFFENGQVSQIGEYARDHEHGVWKVFFDNGKLNAMGSFEDGKPKGRWNYYNAEGRLVQELDYIDGDKFRITNSWDADGVQEIKDGEGIYQTFYENGMLFEKGEIKGGERVGKWTSYYENGTMKEVGRFENFNYILEDAWSETGDVMVEDGNGEYAIYFDGSLNLFQNGSYKNGVKNGYWEVYHPNSIIIQQESNYNNGELHGRNVVYSISGDILVEGNFENGEKVGEWKWYYESGLIQCSVNYVRDKKEGSQVFWSESGRMVKEENYEHGILIAENLL